MGKIINENKQGKNRRTEKIRKIEFYRENKEIHVVFLE